MSACACVCVNRTPCGMLRSFHPMDTKVKMQKIRLSRDDIATGKIRVHEVYKKIPRVKDSLWVAGWYKLLKVAT